jgi:hypothetical protein
VRAGEAVRVYIAPRTTQPTTIGELDGTNTPRLQQIARMFEQAGFPVAINRNMDAWLKTHVALVSPIANALYLAGGDNYRLARTRDGLVLLIRAIRDGLQVLRAHGIPITPPKYRALARLPEPLLVTLLQRGFASERAAVALAGHANAAREEMQCLADEFRTLARATSIPTPAIDRLASYLDPAVQPLVDGSAAIPLDWQSVGEGVGAITGAIFGTCLFQTHRRLGMLSGALAGLLLGKRLTAPHRMPLAAKWQRALAGRRGPVEAARLMARVETRYDELYAGRTHYVNRACVGISKRASCPSSRSTRRCAKTRATKTPRWWKWTTYFTRYLPGSAGMSRCCGCCPTHSRSSGGSRAGRCNAPTQPRAGRSSGSPTTSSAWPSISTAVYTLRQ